VRRGKLLVTSMTLRTVSSVMVKSISPGLTYRLHVPTAHTLIDLLNAAKCGVFAVVESLKSGGEPLAQLVASGSARPQTRVSAVRFAEAFRSWQVGSKTEIKR
jgi:ActR/RegA family two-component response regulator